ncbi:MAG: NAD(P)/FAD-dependent oxidoreductase [Candidatus Dormibacteraceae bacterium]
MATISYDVVVVGAGIAGTSVALELAQYGASVAVVDRRGVGAGSSSINSGGIRTQFSQRANVVHAERTLRRVSSFRETYGEDIAFRRAGYLLLFQEERMAALLGEAVAQQRELGLPNRLITPAEAAQVVPGLAVDDLAGAVFSASDGYLDPRATTSAVGRAARRAGATVLEDWEVVAVDREGDRVTAVRSARGERLVGDRVVNTAGVWSARLARLCGVELPIVGRRSQDFIYDVALPDGRLTPLIIDDVLGLNIHTEGRGFLVGPSETKTYTDPPWSIEHEAAWADQVRERMVQRLPVLREPRLAHAWAGFLDCTPDDNPILGWTGPENLYTFAGFSGHGMCLAPGLAETAAREIRGESVEEAEVDLYRLDRFSRGTSRPEGVWTGSKEHGFGVTHGGPWRPTASQDR